MKSSLAILTATLVTGCSSYCQLKTITNSPTSVDGETPVATYEVVNASYTLFGIIPLTRGVTWKTGPYKGGNSTFNVFYGTCDLEDNLASVRHACKTVGSDKIRNLTGRFDASSFWSLFLVRKHIVKTSCVIVK